jgi:hypothetical protein
MKNIVFHEKELFMRFSKHPQLLSIGAVKHECQSAKLEEILFIIFLFSYDSVSVLPLDGRTVSEKINL